VAGEEGPAGDLPLDRAGHTDVVDQPDHMGPDEAARGRAQRLIEVLDHLGLALVQEHVGTPNRAHVQRLVTGIQNQNLLHLAPKGISGTALDRSNDVSKATKLPIWGREGANFSNLVVRFAPRARGRQIVERRSWAGAL